MKNHGTKESVKATDRSEASYPIYALDEAMRVGQAVKELGGARQSVSKKMLAKQMNLHESGPSFFQRVAASKYFGIIEGRGNYSLSETARRYFYPQQTGEEKKALLDFLRTPPLFAKIIARFDGDALPGNQNLANIFHDSGVPDSWKDRVATIFVRSAQFANALDANGSLRCETAAAEPPNIQAPVREQSEMRPASSVVAMPAGSKKFEFDVGGTKVTLIHPEKLSDLQWTALSAYVTSLAPNKKEEIKAEVSK